MKKRKAGSALVPSWQEPSTLLLEWCLAQDASLSLALHLSNLQRVALDHWQGSPTTPAGTPRILPISDTRALYTILCQAQNKIEEALTRFGGGGLILWVPEGGEQLPRILNSILKLHEKGISLYVQFLIPFSPLPNCETPDLILDLWGHPLLHPKHHNMLRSVVFLKEASKCVCTRDDNPIYSTKNVVSIGVQAGTGGACPRMLSIKEDLILEGLQGEFIYIDFPTGHAAEIRQALHLLSTQDPNLPQVWRIGFRSRGCTRADPRETILGHTPKAADLETRAIVKQIMHRFSNIESVKHISIFVGRQCMFGDSNAILIEANMNQIIGLRSFLGECVLVNPHKALCFPNVGADAISQAITAEEQSHTAVLRFRKSGPMRGQIFAKAKAIREHVQATRRLAFVSRQPQPIAVLLQRQAQLEVLNIDAANHESLPARIMNKVSIIFGTALREVVEQEVELAAGDWKALRWEGHWNGKILLQCTEAMDLAKFFKAVNGRGVCIDGMCRSIEVTSPTVGSLAAEIFTAEANAARSS